MEISVRHNFKDAEKWLDGIRLNQLPYATMLALNETKDRCKDAVLTQMLRKLDRPTDFTMNAWDNKWALRATKRKLYTFLQMKPKQTKYLSPQFYGGTESGRHIVPGKHINLNPYGNLPKSKTKTVKGWSKAKWFYGKPKGGSGPVGFYQRLPSNPKSKAIRLIGHFPGSRSYRKRVDFEGTVSTAFDMWFERNWEKMFDRAMRTAK